MSVTITQQLPRAQRLSHDLWMSIERVTVSGETVNAGGLAYSCKRIATPKTVSIAPINDGRKFIFDPDNNKIQVFNPSGSHTHSVAINAGATAAGASHTHSWSSKAPLIVEEVVAVTDNAGALANTPLYIISVHVTAGDTTGAFNVIPVGKTPLTKQVAVNFSTKALTFLGTDAVTSAKITYLPKRQAGYLSQVIVDETRIAAAAKVNLAQRAGLVQYVWDDTDGVLCGLEPPGEAPSATHKAVIDINDSGNTSIDSHADDEGNTLLVCYVRYEQIPPGCFIDDADVTLSSEGYNFTSAGHYGNTIVPGMGTQVVGEVSGGANSQAAWEGPSGSAAEGVATWNPATNAILTNQDTAMVTTAIPWLILNLDQLTPYGTNAAELTHTHDYGTLATAASGAGDGTTPVEVTGSLSFDLIVTVIGTR